LRKASPIPKVKTSFSIVASSAEELSGCDSSAEAETRAEGEEMTKTPGEFEPPTPITKAERDARKAFRKLDTEKAMTEHAIAQKAFSANRERLKAERLVREAAGTSVAVKKAKTKKKVR
jgi:hypothetical protein